MLTKEIFVDGGRLTSPFYYFYYDAQGTQPIESLSFDIFTSYNFYRLNNVGSHPFYIKDNSGSNEGLNFTGDGSNSSGIKNEENFLLSFDKDIDLTASISYFCTSHASMNFEVEITALEKIANIENNSIVSNLEIGKNYTLSSIRDFDGNFHAKKESLPMSSKVPINIKVCLMLIQMGLQKQYIQIKNQAVG